MPTTTPTIADRINAHLIAGGRCQVTTYTRSTIYDAGHAGWFRIDRTGHLRVRQGRSSVILATPTHMLVSIRLLP